MATFTVKRGATWAIDFDIPTQVDLTDVRVDMQIRKTDDTLVLTASTVGEEPLLALDTVNRKVVLTIPAATSATFPVGSLETDMDFTYEGGFVVSSDIFKIRVKRDVTHV